MILSWDTAYELMRYTLSYNIFGHVIAHLVLEHTINVVTGLSVWYLIDFTTTVPDIHVDMDSDTNRRLISNWYRNTWHRYLIDISGYQLRIILYIATFSIDTFMVGCNIYGRHRCL